MTLEKYGFQSGDIILPGIEMSARLASGTYFRNYGLVPDLRQKSAQIAQELSIGIDANDLRDENFYGVSARHLGIVKSGDIGSAIFVKEGFDKATDIFNYGHESVHAVRNLRRQQEPHPLLVDG